MSHERLLATGKCEKVNCPLECPAEPAAPTPGFCLGDARSAHLLPRTLKSGICFVAVAKCVGLCSTRSKPTQVDHRLRS